MNTLAISVLYPRRRGNRFHISSSSSLIFLSLISFITATAADSINLLQIRNEEQDNNNKYDDHNDAYLICSNATNCLECLSMNITTNSSSTNNDEDQVGCAWALGPGCVPSCHVIKDTKCYSHHEMSLTLSSVPSTSEDICRMVDDDRNDKDHCGSIDDCSACVEEILPSSSTETTPSYCKWSEDHNVCMNDCYPFLGCGTSTCPATATAKSSTSGKVRVTEDNGCTSATTCLECLSRSSQEGEGDDVPGCAWTEGMCEDFCMVADASCYTNDFVLDGASAGAGAGAEEICLVAENDNGDVQSCVSKLDCTSCVNTLKSDGVDTCRWFVSVCSPDTYNALGFAGATECPNDGTSAGYNIKTNTNIFIVGGLLYSQQLLGISIVLMTTMLMMA